MESRPTAPGLKWRKRKGGPDVPYWIASGAARKAKYPIKLANLSCFVDDPKTLKNRCIRLQAEMTTWLAGHKSRTPVFDGTFASLLDIYFTDPESSYRKLKPGSQHPYDIYGGKLRAHIGSRRIDACDGRDVKRWFEVWMGAKDHRLPEAKLPSARMALCVLKAAISFGIVCRHPGCADFQTILAQLQFPTNVRRTFAPTAEQVTLARQAAHRAGFPSRALSYALQFETTLRQWDVTGEWIPLSDYRPSAVLFYGAKWIGPGWANIDQNLILHTTPTKTEDTTAATTDHDLRLCPMVMEEIARVPPENRTGPLIVDERTGLPYTYQSFKDGWRADFKAAGLPAKMWNRDLRAGGVTEGRKAGASLEDSSKVAGHSGTKTTGRVYDRDTLEAHRRVRGAINLRRTNKDGA